MSQFPTFPELIARKREALNTKISLRNQYAAELDEVRKQDGADPARVDELRASKARAEAEIPGIRADLETFEREYEADKVAQARTEERHPTGATAPGPRADDSTPDVQAGDWISLDTGERANLLPGERLADHPVMRNRRQSGQDTVDRFGSFGMMLRSLTTTTGSAIVPEVWSANIIDKAREASQIVSRGTVIPMPSKKVTVGRVVQDPSVAFRLELGAVNISDPTIDAVELEAKSLATLVKVSRELLQDAEQAEALVIDTIAKAMAAHLDKVALYGGTLPADPSGIDLAAAAGNPTGVLFELLAALPANVLGGGAANGTPIVVGATGAYLQVLESIGKVQDGNDAPTAWVVNSKLARRYDGLVDSTFQPLRAPAAVEAIPRAVLNVIPSFTRGTAVGTASDMFLGDWSQLLVGVREQIEVQILDEAFATTGEVGILVHYRGDFALARPGAFSIYRYLIGA